MYNFPCCFSLLLAVVNLVLLRCGPLRPCVREPGVFALRLNPAFLHPGPPRQSASAVVCGPWQRRVPHRGTAVLLAEWLDRGSACTGACDGWQRGGVGGASAGTWQRVQLCGPGSTTVLQASKGQLARGAVARCWVGARSRRALAVAGLPLCGLVCAWGARARCDS